MCRPIRAAFAAALLALAFPPAATAADECPWWRPCGPGKTSSGNRFISQSKSGVDFRSACQKHDECYAAGVGCRKDCDQQFLQNMLDLCEAAGNPPGSRRRAKISYLGVRLFGASSFGEPLDE